MTTLAVTSVNSLLCHASTCFRMGSKFLCMRSTPTEMQSMRENDFECFASTGVNTPETMSPNSGCCEIQLPRSRLDRHRGGGHPPTPATPPCVRVRTRRFELVALAAIDECRKSKRFEVSIGKPNREGFGPGQIPGAKSAAGRV